MKPHHSRDAWSRLTAAAREVSDERDTSAPFGFATRIVARSFGSERRVVSLVERFALRALGVAALVALVSALVNYPSLQSRPAPAVAYVQEPLAADEAIAIVLELSAD